ncbi:hypothetical protein PISMIDRAFT_598601 [Pisolithus microcarpus 441]|uniref:Uncharacterized protein n=1 Tax=Pisolithus microcarpus 441 TaxID=765257 RepID=A0A0C9YTZ9_9AGAM|nr:hypothetical protein PISMIDRAFT_598601 [Pisolithus microcarpus 441]
MNDGNEPALCDMAYGTPAYSHALGVHCTRLSLEIPLGKKRCVALHGSDWSLPFTAKRSLAGGCKLMR